MAKRIYSIDAMRIIAMVFVVLIHTDPFQGVGAYGNMVNFVIKTSARFAVPFFFLTSGYLFALKTSHRDPTAYVATRVRSITSIYIFGLLVCLPVFFIEDILAAVDEQSLVSASIPILVDYLSPAELIYYGTSITVVLWFLPALIFSFIFVYVFVKIDKTAYLLSVALGFHIIGLLGSSYTMFIDIPFEIRDALFFGFFYTSLGYSIYASDWDPSVDRSRRYLGATVFFVVLQLGEYYLLGYVVPGETFGQGVFAPSYAITTVFLTGSLFVYLLSRPRLGASTRLPEWGAYAVGIYVTHPAVLAGLRLLDDGLTTLGYPYDGTLLWHLTATPVTFFGGLAVYLAAHKIGVIEIGGSHLPGVSRIRKYG